MPGVQDYEAALAIEADLNGRKGFDLGALDDEIRAEILQAWAEIISNVRSQ